MVLPINMSYDAKNERKVYRDLFRKNVDRQINHEYDVTTSQKALSLDMYELKTRVKTKKKDANITKRIDKIVKDLLPQHIKDLEKHIELLAKDEKGSTDAWELYLNNYTNWYQQRQKWLEDNNKQTLSVSKKALSELGKQHKKLLAEYKTIDKSSQKLTTMNATDMAASLVVWKDQLHDLEAGQIDLHGAQSLRYLHRHKDLGVQQHIVSKHQVHLIEELTLLKDRSLTTKLIARLKSKHVTWAKR
jgi:hypothetical protein